MELMQLEMLVAVAEERSFLRAAERVFRTQPAVSIGLRKLEGRMGVPLIDRSSRRSGRLTPAGERLYEYARKILVLRDEALSVVKREDRPPESTLRVGLVGEESLTRFLMLWKWFKEQYPGVELKIQSDSVGSVLGELAGGRLDVALVSGRPRCNAESKNLVVRRVRDVSGHGCLWVVLQRVGRSPLAHELEKVLAGNVSSSARISKPKTIGLPRIRVVR